MNSKTKKAGLKNYLKYNFNENILYKKEYIL